MKRSGSVLSAAILLAGACIGTGYYAIPVTAGPAGFFAAAVMTIIVGIYILSTGLLYLEATLACPDGANVISITNQLIGKTGMVIATVSFVFIKVLLLVFFYSFISNFFAHLLDYWFTVSINPIWLKLSFGILFTIIVYLGTYISDRVNFVLFLGLIISFLVTVFLGADKVEMENLYSGRWYLVVFSVPLIVTAFDYQSLLPTLSTYLKRDAKRLVTMVLIALSLSLVVYLAWIWLVIGSTPHGLIWQAFEQKKPMHEGLALLKGTYTFQKFLYFTAIFAIATSFISNGLAFTDFMSDAFKIPVEKRTGYRRFLACLVLFVSAFIINLIVTDDLLMNLGASIGWGEVIFNGAIPLWLAVRSRYILQLDTKRLLPGGKWSIIILLIATFFLIYLKGVQILLA